jgi:hypothetical protein
MGNRLVGNGHLDRSGQLFKFRSVHGSDKIKVFGKTPSVVTPADGRSSLEYEADAFGARIKALEENELEKLGAADMSFGVRFHLFK